MTDSEKRFLVKDVNGGTITFIPDPDNPGDLIVQGGTIHSKEFSPDLYKYAAGQAIKLNTEGTPMPDQPATNAIDEEWFAWKLKCDGLAYGISLKKMAEMMGKKYNSRLRTKYLKWKDLELKRRDVTKR